MRIPGKKSLRLGFRWLRSRLLGGTLILGYHRVTNATRDPFSISVTPKNFAEQVEILSQLSRPIRLMKLVQDLGINKINRRSVVLTFDDGYADFLEHALPVLEFYQVPATIFVVTGNIGAKFWWDDLEDILFSASITPDNFPDTLGGLLNKVSLGKHFDIIENGMKLGRQLLSTLYNQMAIMSPDERNQVLDNVKNSLKIENNARTVARSMTGEELQELARSGFVEVGAHSVSHPMLASLSLEEQRAEIFNSRLQVEKILGQPVTSFSYPNGSCSQATISLVRELGYECACASYNDVTMAKSNPYYLPRFWVPNWNGSRFYTWLRWWIAN